MRGGGEREREREEEGKGEREEEGEEERGSRNMKCYISRVRWLGFFYTVLQENKMPQCYLWQKQLLAPAFFLFIWNCNFPVSPYVRLVWLDGWSKGWPACHNFV